MTQSRLIFAVASLLSLFSFDKLLGQINLVEGSNSGFEAGFGSWEGNGLPNASIDLMNPGDGSRSAKLTANSSNGWNTLVHALIPTFPGRSYQLSVRTRQNLVGGTALVGLNELDSSLESTKYTWKAMSISSAWHTEYLTITPRADTHYVRIYLWVDNGATSGAAWWDNCRLVEVSSTPMADAPANSFADDTDATIDVAPLPVAMFTKSGTTITPSLMVPSVNYGTALVGGTLAWKVVTAGAGPSGTVILGGSSTIPQTGLWAWTIDLNSAAGTLVPGNYLLVIDAANREASIVRNAVRRFNIQ